MNNLDIIKEFRQRTNVSVAKCKEALEKTENDIELAIRWLQEQSIQILTNNNATTSEGRIFTYVHANKKIGVLLKLKCQTDFVAKTDEFNVLGNDLCLQIASENPLYVSKEDISERELNSQQNLLSIVTMKEMTEKGGFKTDKQELLQKIVDGKLNKWFKEVCLSEQKFIKNDKVIIKQLLSDLSMKCGEKIEVALFVREVL